jgi:hypothetical protein
MQIYRVCPTRPPRKALVAVGAAATRDPEEIETDGTIRKKCFRLRCVVDRLGFLFFFFFFLLSGFGFLVCVCVFFCPSSRRSLEIQRMSLLRRKDREKE